MRSLFRPRERPGEPEAGPRHGPGPRSAPDVVIVDDSAGVRNVLRLVIEKAGLGYAVATSLDEVVALDLKGATSLVLLDLALDRSDAIDVLRHLATVRFAGTVVPMSGQDAVLLEYVGTFGRQHGLTMRPPLKKPFRVDALRAILPVRRDTAAVHVDFREALDKGEVEVWYQPRIHLGAFLPFGFEATVRVRDPRGRVLEAGRFAGQLDDAQSAEMTAHVLREATTVWKRMAAIGLVLKPCITVRARDLSSPLLVESLKAGWPDDPRWSGLLFKVTEPQVVDEVPSVRDAIVRLRLHRVQFALADFGATAGSLVKSPELQLSGIEVDARFVRNCSREPERHRVCAAAAQLGKTLKVQVVAEGVDTLDDMRAIRDLGFDGAQGGLFSAPTPFAGFEEQLRSREPLIQPSRAGTAA